MSISIKFCGGTRHVTGSMHLISSDSSKVLLDCGLFHGRRDDTYRINSNFNFDPTSVDAAVISHAHIDHTGNLPNLVKQGFKKSIYLTPPTKELCEYMLRDSGHIQEEDVKYINKINARKGWPLREPLYTSKDAEISLKYLESLEYYKEKNIADNITLKFLEAGHILGSSIPVLTIKDKTKTIKIAYAVDLGRNNMPLLRDIDSPEDIDYLIIESTYGARKHDSIEAAEEELTESINNAIERQGKIIIPSFALERTQLIVYFISELIKRGKVPKIPIYVDSPLAVNLTDVFRKNYEYFDDITKQAFMKDHDPLGYDNITYVRSVEESKALNFKPAPMIIISAAGMCENGRILHHLKNNIEDSKNTIVVIGFMAKNTLGRRIVEREQNSEVKIFGRPHRLKAKVVTLNAFSSHADKVGLKDFVLKCNESKKLKKVFIVHGEEEQSLILKKSLDSLGINSKVPYIDDEVIL